MLALLFSVQSIPAVQSTGYAIPIAQLYFDAVGHRLTLMCLSVIALAQFMAAATAFTASSRLMYALARDNAIPMKRHFMLLNRFQAPVVGIWLSVLVGCIISCAYIGSIIAVSCCISSLLVPMFLTVNVFVFFYLIQFNAILSSAAISVMLGYMQPILIRVFWPSAYVFNRYSNRTPVIDGYSRMKERGPFHLGRWSLLINISSLSVRLVKSHLARASG